MQARGELTLVFRYSRLLLDRLFGRSLVIRVSSLEEMQDAYNRAHEENQVRCVDIELRSPLSSIALRDAWKAIPICLHVPEMGDLKRVLKRAKQFREWNIRVFMPADRVDNLTSLRILSSLGIPTGLTLNGSVDWDGLNDLMHYAMYTRTPHADIDPFAYVKSSYNPQEFTYLLTPLFQNPLKYVHIDDDENIALSAADLAEGRWIGRGIESLAGLQDRAEYLHRLNSWQSLFLEDQRCAYCPAWRLCRGEFLQSCERDGNVFRFFEDFMAAADSSLAARQAGSKWLP